ncbi:MAG: hypothetical protein KAR13_21000 [Desulfobulbaceae bacterium]|nr:hypothetical protein [Desulfobulbaceae bacterium]
MVHPLLELATALGTLLIGFIEVKGLGDDFKLSLLGRAMTSLGLFLLGFIVLALSAFAPRR